jgi:N-acetylneuraminic acid mutarotase
MDDRMPPKSGSGGKRFAGAFTQVPGDPEVYCIGGYIMDPAAVEAPWTQVTNRVQAYNVDNGAWRDVGDLEQLPEALAFSAAAADTNGFIYVMGGIDDGGVISNKVFMYDTVQNDPWTDVTGIDPVPDGGRYSFIAASIGDMIYISGGLTDTVTSDPANYSPKVYSYDPSAAAGSKWTPLPDLPRGRRCHAMVALGNVLCVIGGFIYGDDMDDILALDTTNLGAGWIVRESLPHALAGHTAAVANGKIYVLSGWSLTGIQYDVVEYDPVSNSTRILSKNGNPARIGWPRYWNFIGVGVVQNNWIASISGYGGSPGNIATTEHGGKTHFNQVYVYDLTLPDP